MMIASINKTSTLSFPRTQTLVCLSMFRSVFLLLPVLVADVFVMLYLPLFHSHSSSDSSTAIPVTRKSLLLKGEREREREREREARPREEKRNPFMKYLLYLYARKIIQNHHSWRRRDDRIKKEKNGKAEDKKKLRVDTHDNRRQGCPMKIFMIKDHPFFFIPVSATFSL